MRLKTEVGYQMSEVSLPVDVSARQSLRPQSAAGTQAETRSVEAGGRKSREAWHVLSSVVEKNEKHDVRYKGYGRETRKIRRS